MLGTFALTGGRVTEMRQIVSRNIEEELRRGRLRRMPMSRAINIVGGAELRAT